VLRDRLPALLDAALDGRRLLTHPFYRRWEAGELRLDELAAYAGQYRRFEAALPELLETIAAGLDRADAAAAVRANLADERGTPSHLELFDDFLAAVGGCADDPPGPAAEALVAAHRDLAATDPGAALAALAAYEVQAPLIAATKAEGLRTRYGLGDAGTRFWDVHATLETRHAGWTLDALAATERDDGVLTRAARTAADSWWAFLDERQAAA
jgi:pyrroloquinoline-quinone synthase